MTPRRTDFMMTQDDLTAGAELRLSDFPKVVLFRGRRGTAHKSSANKPRWQRGVLLLDSLADQGEYLLAQFVERLLQACQLWTESMIEIEARAAHHAHI